MGTVRSKFKSKTKTKNESLFIKTYNTKQFSSQIKDHPESPVLPSTNDTSHINQEKEIIFKKLPQYNIECSSSISSNQVEQISRPHFSNGSSVVLIASTFLYPCDFNDDALPLGLVLKVLFQNDDWLYVRALDGREGYISSDICLPLEISFFLSNHAQPHSSTEDSLKLIYEPGTHVESSNMQSFSEQNVDILYLQSNGIRYRQLSKSGAKPSESDENSDWKITILVIKNDYESKESHKTTLTVKKGEIVYLLHTEVAGWYWVRNERHEEGYVPAMVTAYLHSGKYENRIA